MREGFHHAYRLSGDGIGCCQGDTVEAAVAPKNVEFDIHSPEALDRPCRAGPEIQGQTLVLSVGRWGGGFIGASFQSGPVASRRTMVEGIGKRGTIVTTAGKATITITLNVLDAIAIIMTLNVLDAIARLVDAEFGHSCSSGRQSWVALGGIRGGGQDRVGRSVVSVVHDLEGLLC